MKAVPAINHRQKDNILYYPFIKIPNGDWIRTSLMYWDEVSAIVPDEWEETNRYPDHIIDLANEGLFRAIRPNLAYNSDRWYERFKLFETEFIAIINSQPYVERLRAAYKNGIELTTTIYRDKISDSIKDFLIERKLAVDVIDKYQLLVEKFTALIYMSLLAKYLASIDTSHTIPGTNEKIYFNLIFSKSEFITENACFDLRLNDILPVPRKTVSLKKILKFKEQRRGELLSFRSVINDLQVRLSEAQSVHEANELVRATRNEIISGASALKATLRDARIETMVGAFKTLINIKNAAILTTSEAAMEYLDASTALKVGVPIATGIVELSHYFVQRNNQVNSLQRNSAFAYVYNASNSKIT